MLIPTLSPFLISLNFTLFAPGDTLWLSNDDNFVMQLPSADNPLILVEYLLESPK